MSKERTNETKAKELTASNLRVVHGAVRVKNAFLMHEETEDTFILQHYDTIVLGVEKGSVFLIKPNISLSTNRAIQQAFDYIGIDAVPKDYKKCDHLGANQGSKYGKYEMSTRMRMKAKDAIDNVVQEANGQ